MLGSRRGGLCFRERAGWRRVPRGCERGLTLAELLIAIVIMGFLGALLLGSISQARERARSLACLNNLKQLGVAVQLYAADNHNALPPFFYQAVPSGGQYSLQIIPRWSLDDIGPGASATSLLCPSDKRPSVMNVTNAVGAALKVNASYYYNINLMILNLRTTSVRLASTALLWEGTPDTATQVAWWGNNVTSPYGPNNTYTWCHCASGNPSSCITLSGTGPVPPGHSGHTNDYPGPCGGGAASNLQLVNQSLEDRHLKFANVLYLDGHLEERKALAVADLYTP